MVDFKKKLQNENALATTTGATLAPIENPSFNLPALLDPEEAIEVIAENMSEFGGSLKFDKVKMPSGGALTFEILDENGEATPVQEIKGVVLDFYPIKAFWGQEYTGENNPPDCSSMDAKIGAGNVELGIPQGQACVKCPNNQWGSDPKGGRGKACKDIFRVYVLQEGCMFPKLVALPPTSIANWRDYVKRLTDKMKVFYGVVTTIKLEKDKNEGGIVYSKATFARAAEMTREEKRALKQYAAQLKDAMRSVAIDSTEYAIEEDAQAEIPIVGAATDTDEPY